MCEADLSAADLVVIFKGDFACLQPINSTNSTTRDLVFMGGTKFYLIYAESSRWNTLMCNIFFTKVYDESKKIPLCEKLTNNELSKALKVTIHKLQRG